MPGTVEHEAALEMLAELPAEARKTVGADKAYDSEAFIEGCRQINVIPHVAQDTSGQSSRIDGSTTRHTPDSRSVSAPASSSRPC